MPTELLTTKEAARILRVTPLTLRNWIREGKGPPYVKLGSKTFRYSRAALLEYLGVTERAEGACDYPKSKRGHKAPKTKKSNPTPVRSVQKIKQRLTDVMLSRCSLTMPDVRIVLEIFGVKRLSELPVEHHSAFIAAMEKLGARLDQTKRGRTDDA